MQYSKVYDRSGMFLGVLENAKAGYTLKSVPISTAKVVLPLDDEGNSLCTSFNRVEIFDGDQRVDLFRFIAMPKGTIRQGGSLEYKAEHVIATLMDKIMPGYHEIGGTGVTLADCIRYILGFQAPVLWQLGTCDFTTQFQYSFSDAYLLNALLALPKQLDEDYQWITDTTTTPWTLSLVRPSSAVECEILYRHNMTEIGKTYDDATLCTRCYPRGYGEGMNQLTIRDANNGQEYIDADTQALWGVVEKPFVDTTMEQAEALKRRATQWLEGYKNPRITYTAKALDLSRMTGEPMDTFYPGKLCRVNDREHGVLVAVRITQTSKNDPAGKPEDITVTLSNSTETIANSIADLAARASVNELTAQGATNLFQMQFWNNADEGHPVTLDVDIPAECVRVNKLWLTLRTGSFRNYSLGAAAGGATVETTSSGGGGSRTSSGGGQQSITKEFSISTSNNTTGSALDSSSAYAKNNTGESEPFASGASSRAVTAGASNYITSEGGGHSHTGPSHQHNLTGHSHSFSGSDSVGNGHTHNVTVKALNTSTATTGVSTNSTHSISISGTTGGSGTLTTYSAGTGDTSTVGNHTHSMGHTHDMDHTHSVPAHSHGMQHFHMVNTLVSIPAMTISIQSHTHEVDIPEHSHSITLEEHEHDNVPGIYDGETVSTVTVQVDANVLPQAARSGDKINLIPYLAKDSTGKVTRTNHLITLTPVPTTGNPDGLCSISSNVSCVVFIRSQGGGDY